MIMMSFLARRTLKKKSAGGAEAFTVVWSPDRGRKLQIQFFIFQGNDFVKRVLR